LENKKLKNRYICYFEEKLYRFLGITAGKTRGGGNLDGGCGAGYPVCLRT
jgi:hypothetical protein